MHISFLSCGLVPTYRRLKLVARGERGNAINSTTTQDNILQNTGASKQLLITSFSAAVEDVGETNDDEEGSATLKIC